MTGPPAHLNGYTAYPSICLPPLVADGHYTTNFMAPIVYTMHVRDNLVGAIDNVDSGNELSP